jgi:hypothetical protein
MINCSDNESSLHTFTMKNLPKLLSHFDSRTPLVLAPSVALTVVVAIASGNVDHHDTGGYIRMSLILRPNRPKRPRSPLRKSRTKATAARVVSPELSPEKRATCVRKSKWMEPANLGEMRMTCVQSSHQRPRCCRSTERAWHSHAPWWLVASNVGRSAAVATAIDRQAERFSTK